MCLSMVQTPPRVFNTEMHNKNIKKAYTQQSGIKFEKLLAYISYSVASINHMTLSNRKMMHTDRFRLDIARNRVRMLADEFKISAKA